MQLDKTALIGKGYYRFYYRHPDNSGLCIKIPMTPDDEEHMREQACYRLLLRRNVSFEMVAKFHGDVEANFGTGAIFLPYSTVRLFSPGPVLCARIRIYLNHQVLLIF